MMMPFSTPSAEEARHFVRTVDSTEAFVATIMSPSAGARAAHLFSLEMVDRFLEARTIEEFRSVGLRLDIHYVDFGFLADWLEEVIGDADLAMAIRGVNVGGAAFGVLVPQAKSIVHERLEQCGAVIEASEALPAASAQ